MLSWCVRSSILHAEVSMYFYGQLKKTRLSNGQALWQTIFPLELDRLQILVKRILVHVSCTRITDQWLLHQWDSSPMSVNGVNLLTEKNYGGHR